MRFLIFLLLLMPSVCGLAVTPTSLDFGETERGNISVRELLVANTLDQQVTIKLSGIYYDSFILEPGDSKILDIGLEAIDKEDGKYEDIILIEEDYGSNIANGIFIPVKYRVRGGEYTSDSLKLENVKVDNKGQSFIFYFLGATLLAGGTLGFIKRRTKESKVI